MLSRIGKKRFGIRKRNYFKRLIINETALSKILQRRFFVQVNNFYKTTILVLVDEISTVLVILVFFPIIMK